ncbi:transposase [Geobacillus sp. GHH01]|uniref:hypothetical protein n=1 Tax=Geobacillus sp. GHH01 TaxID=1233873 RepID=UPI0002AF20EE|nr:transposase [Geobacillus sp. GHH01]
MYRTLKTRFRAKKEVIDKLFECNRISAEVWNECLRLAKEHHLKTGKWITKTELQKATKGRYRIHETFARKPLPSGMGRNCLIFYILQNRSKK